MAPRGAASPSSPPSAVPSAFPGGLYGKYKRATGYFLDWLLRARLGGVGASISTVANANKKKKKKIKRSVALTVYDDIVNAIAHEPTTLPPSLLRLWPRALAACETAITLRTRVALFFPPTSNDSDDSHAHFLERLRSWLTLLQQTERPPIATTAQESATLDFANYYAVLELPDDYFSESTGQDDEVQPAKSPSSGYNVSTTDRKQLFDETFDNDLNVELSFLFMELEELSEAVYDIFREVKLQKKTLVEATAVAKIAIDCAASVIAKLQLKYPSIRTAQDMMTMIQDRIPSEQLDDLLADVATAWTFDDDDDDDDDGVGCPDDPTSKSPRSRYTPGTIVVDLLWVGRALQSFAAMLPANGDGSTCFVLREGMYGDAYSEDATPHYCTPLMYTVPSFFLQQLPLLYNALLANRAGGFHHDTKLLSGWFLDLVDNWFFKSPRSVSIHVVFVCICWIRSVAALQGDGALGRTISLSLSHRWDLNDRLRASMAHGGVKKVDASLHTEMEQAVATQQQLDNAILLVRANPLLAGCMQLDCQLRFLHLGTEALLLTSHVRAFGHLYHAFCDRALLEKIPFVEEMLAVYARSIFTPSRDVAVHGAFTRSYLVSSNTSEAAIDALLGHRAPVPDRYATQIREYYRLPDLSRVVRLLTKKDFSVVLPRSSVPTTTASWRSLLRAVSDLCSEELFTTRVLSRDMLKVNDDVTDVFNLMCDTMGRRHDADAILRNLPPGTAGVFARRRAVEDVVVMPLLPFLDCLHRDGSISVTQEAKAMLRLDSARAMLLTLDGNSAAIRDVCRRAADVVAMRFGHRSPLQMDATYHIFPRTPTWRSLAFGDISYHMESAPMDETVRHTFTKVLEMMERSDAPLQGNALERLQSWIRGDPRMLAMTRVDKPTELPTLLHHAAAGRARDRRLVEWLIQMGALRCQPSHCGNRQADAGRGKPLSLSVDEDEDGENGSCNALAVHAAAVGGDVDMVRLLLEADQLRDLNTVTYHTRESLAHLAVKHGHRRLFQLLQALGADVRHHDASGKYVYDYTSDATWKAQIVRLAVDQRRQEELARAHKSRDQQLHRESEATAEQLRRSLEAQREQERATRLKGAGGAATGEAMETTSKNKKKKNKKKKTTTAVSTEDEALAVERMQQLLVTDTRGAEQFVAQPATSGADRIEELRSALDSLKQGGSTACREEREAHATRALEIVDALRNTVQFLRSPSGKHGLLPSIHERLALEASQAIFLLAKYQRRLPEPPRRAHDDFWKLLVPEDDKATLSSLEKLHKRVGGSSFDFGAFLTFVLHTSHALASCGRLPQAKELLELLERRLLKMKQRAPTFRKYVELYVDARREMGIEPANGSTPQAQRAFEWYLDNYPEAADEMTLLHVDLLHGCEWFLKLKSMDTFDSRAFQRFSDLVDGVGGLPRHRELENVVFVDSHYIAVGADSREQLTRILELLLEMATQSGLDLEATTRDLHVATKKLSLLGFEFSATEIVRESGSQ